MSLSRRLLPVVLLILGAYPLFFYGLAERELTSSHEARAAQDAQMMLTTGDWTLPRLFDKQIDLQKPPLYYWLIALLAKLEGGQVDALAVRLPAALCALGAAALMLFIGFRVGRPVTGCFAALMLASFWHFTWMARVGRIDMPLTMTVTAALVGFWLARREPDKRRRWLLLAYASIGLGVLFKGPIAVALPALVIVVWLIVERYTEPPPVAALRSLGLWWGVPLVLAIAAPWFLWANHATDGKFFRVFFLYHNVERGLGGDGSLATHPWWFYGARLAVDLLPWNLLVPAALWCWWRNPEWRRDREMGFGLVWLMVIALFLSAMRFKRADYLLPAYPGLALFLGGAAERWKERLGRRLVGGLSLGFVGCMAAWVGLAQSALPAQDAGRPYRAFAGEIRRHTGSHVLFFRVESHPLAFHVGRPLHTLLEWENLDVWAGKDQPVYVVLDADTFADWPKQLQRGRLEVVSRFGDFLPAGTRPNLRDDFLILARTRALTAPPESN